MSVWFFHFVATETKYSICRLQQCETGPTSLFEGRQKKREPSYLHQAQDLVLQLVYVHSWFIRSPHFPAKPSLDEVFKTFLCSCHLFLPNLHISLWTALIWRAFGAILDSIYLSYLWHVTAYIPKHFLPFGLLCDAVKTSPKLHIWHCLRSISIACCHGDGGGRWGWLCAGCVQRGCVATRFPDVGQVSFLVWTVQFTWRSSSDVTDCGFLCPACLICHPAAWVTTPFSVWTFSAKAFPISHLLYKLTRIYSECKHAVQMKPSTNPGWWLSGTVEGESQTPAESLRVGSAFVGECVAASADVMIPARLLHLSQGFTHMEHITRSVDHFEHIFCVINLGSLL